MATPQQAEATMVENLKANTGRSLDGWIGVVQASKLARHGEIVKMLKADHGLGHGFANLIAHKTLEKAGGGPAGDDELVAAQYAGGKAGLRPIYEALVAAVKAFGPDVELAPKKAYVSLRRSKQFGLIQPSTATRVDVGINLKGVDAGARLEASGSFNAMVSHRVRVARAPDVDAALIGWLRAAYEQA